MNQITYLSMCVEMTQRIVNGYQGSNHCTCNLGLQSSTTKAACLHQNQLEKLIFLYAGKDLWLEFDIFMKEKSGSYYWSKQCHSLEEFHAYLDEFFLPRITGN